MARLVLCMLASTAGAGYGLLGAGAVARATGAVGAAAEVAASMARKRDAASMAYVAGDFLLIKREGGKLEFAEVLAGSGPGMSVQVLAHGLKQEKASKRVQQLEWYGGKKWHKVTVHDEASNKRRPEASNRIAKSTWDEASKLNFQQLSPQQVVDRFRAAKEQASKPKFRQLSAQQLIDTFKENSEIVKAPVQESTHADDANPPPDDEVDYYYEKLQEQALADYEKRFA